jgi:putative membrane protein insertion efficiency factor
MIFWTDMLNKFFILLVKIYQKLISPFFISSCRFTPTCSEYTIDALKKYNIFYALLLVIKRIFKCHPWNRGGHDPLP